MSRVLEEKTKSVCVDQNESCNAEATEEILQKKLQTKTERVVLLTQELEQCRIQRDQLKSTVEQMQERFLRLKKQMNDMKEQSLQGDSDFRTLDLLAEVREQNKCLKLQVETLRQKLSEAQGDINVLRTNNHRTQVVEDIQLAPAAHQREEMIEQLEKFNLKCSQLQADLQTVLDEKHELEIERNAFKCKAHRLNHELSKALNASHPVDLDALINENRYLQDRIQQLMEEKELARQSLLKYKGMLDSKMTKGAITLGTNSTAGTVMTHKQVEQLLQQGTNVPPQKAAAAISDLRCLCTALLEALNDKTLALAHQKKANKILALRICELDTAVQSPTMRLLEGYVGAEVDLKSNDDVKDLNSIPGIDSIEEHSIVTNGVETQNTPTPPENPVMQQLHSIHMNLPKNLSLLVQKALNNLKENDKSKS